MATESRECRSCRSVIHAKATICPHCRSKQRPDLIQVGCLLVVGLTVFGFVAASFGPTSNKTAPESDKATFLAAHASDPKALQDRFGSDADARCTAGADTYLRSVAAHDFQWDEIQGGWLGYKFDKYSTRSVRPGLLTVISDKAKLSNAFGAFQHIDLYCLYDVGADKVVKFSQTDPANDMPDPPQDVAIDPSTGIAKDVDLGNKPDGYDDQDANITDY